MSLPRSRFDWFRWTALALACLGCRPEPEIRTYAVPKEEKAAASRVTMVGAAGSADRMLAAILPDGERAWFFKVVGPQAEVDARAAQIDAFFASLRPAAGQPLPEWQLPEGWQSQPASGMRAATLLIPADPQPLELTVTQLGWTGTRAELLGNVNRWRGQMQLPPIAESQLGESTRQRKVGDATITIVDLTGRVQSNMGAPRRNAPPGDLPAGHPPVAAPPLRFDVPEGWIELPAGGMRKAAFGIQEGDQRALVTVLDFPVDAGPKMADPLENVNRWRGEVGLGPIAADALDEATEPIEIDGGQARYVAAIPDAALQSDRATLAAMLRRGDVMWFFKLTGDRDLVASQQDKFQAFLGSVRFDGQGGAIDGN